MEIQKHISIRSIKFIVAITLLSLVVTLFSPSTVKAADYYSSASWPADGVSYYIRNIKSGKYLDLFGTPTNGANVGLWSGHKGTNQQWKFRLSPAYTEDSHVYQIYSVANPNYCLSVKGNSSANWTELVVQYNTSSAPMESCFWIDPHWIQSNIATWKPSGWFRLKTASSSWEKNIDCYYGNTGDGTHVIQYDRSDDLNQFWYFERVDTSGNSKLQAWNFVDSGKHLDVQIDSSYSNLVKDAMAMWNSYKPGVIREDTLTTIEDVRVFDTANACSASNYWLGRTTSSTREIMLNKTILDFFNNPAIIRHTVAHELGHALGIDHWDYNSPDIANANCGDIMISAPYGIPHIGYRDKASYDIAYNRY